MSTRGWVLALGRMVVLLLVAGVASTLGGTSARAQIALPIVKQAPGSADCSPASIAMILQWYQRSGRLDENLGTDLESVIKAFEAVSGKPEGPYSTAWNGPAVKKLVGDAVELRTEWIETPDEMRAFLKAQVGSGVPVQMIMNSSSLGHLPYSTAGWLGGHSMVVFGINGDSVTYADPWPSEFPDARTVSLQEFDQLWRFPYPAGSQSFTRYAMYYVPSRPPFPAPSDFVVKEDVNARSGFGFAIDATWKDNSNGEDGFQLYYRADGKSSGKTTKAGADETRARISGIAFDDVAPEKNRVCYWVVATRQGVESAPSNESCIDRLSVWDRDAQPPGSLPTKDSDGDGIPDSSDQCPSQKETVNSYQDSDGCPDTPPSKDSDGDGIPDSSDQCPSQKETVNGYQDSDGCPDTPPSKDSDGDGIPDSSDQCPTQKETVNGHQDSDGCPDTAPPKDGDGDGVTDDKDQCPTQKGPASNNGCPDLPPSTRSVTVEIVWCTGMCPQVVLSGSALLTIGGKTFTEDWAGTSSATVVFANIPSGTYTVSVHNICQVTSAADYIVCQGQLPTTYSLTAWSDKTSYKVGDPIELCYQLSPQNVPFEVLLKRKIGGGAWEQISSWSDNGVGGGGCVPGTIGGAAGGRVYRLEASIGGAPVASAEFSVNVVADGGGGGGSCSEFPQAPTGLFVFGTVGGTASKTRTIQWSPGYAGGSGCTILEYEVFNDDTGAHIYSGTSTTTTVTVSTGCSMTVGVQQRNQRGWSPTAYLKVTVC